MGRGIDTAGRLDKLNRALERAKALPEDTVLEANPMAQLIGFSWVTLRDWCDSIAALDGSTAYVRGGNGIRWQFKPVPMIEALIAAFKADADQAAAKNRDLKKRVGVEVPESESTASLDETRKLIAMTFDVIDRRNAQKLYVRADRMCEFIEGFSRAVSDGIMGVDAEIDPTGRLAPAVRKLVNDALIGVASRTHDSAKKFVEDYRASLREAGVNG